jgi:osmotically-inducible protein OsmY
VKDVHAVADELEVRLRPETRLTDDAIAAAAMERLAWDVSVPLGSVQVIVEDGWVTLSGEVEWHYQRAAAEQDVQRLHGVVGVNNRIAIKSILQASDIGDEIMHALHRSWFFDPKTINVTAEDGTVRLTGTVHSAHERQVAAATAWSAPGVTEVENHIRIV